MNKRSLLRRVAPIVALGIVLLIAIEIYDHFTNPRIVIALIGLTVYLLYLLIRWLSKVREKR